MPAKRIALIIHAGAGSYPKDFSRAPLDRAADGRLDLRCHTVGTAGKIQKKLGKILEKGYRFLKNHSAVETVVEVVRSLEDWSETNAGRGSMLQSDGKARLSAAVMDGSEMRFSGVINIENVKNPILVAYKLQKERDRILAARGAQMFAQQQGFKKFDLRTKESLKRWRDHKVGAGLKPAPTSEFGTVGACALDSNGRLASATSTGGKGMERAGRVSDSALPAGNYANSFAAISATGLGEDIVEEALASAIAVRAGDLRNLEKVFLKTFEEAKLRNRRFAAIGVDWNGKTFWAGTTEILYYAFRNSSDAGVFPLAPRS